MKLVFFFTAAALATSAAPVMDCANLASKPFGSDVKIESAKPVAAAANLPAHCEVKGVIWPEARFVVKLPTEWNERFQMVGNGGWAGSITTAAVDAAVKLG